MRTRSSDPGGFDQSEFKKFKACGDDSSSSSSSDSDSDSDTGDGVKRPRGQSLQKKEKFKNIAKVEPLVPE